MSNQAGGVTQKTWENSVLVKFSPVFATDRSIKEGDMITGGKSQFYARQMWDLPKLLAEIDWQDGTIDPEKGANGVTCEAMIEAVIGRLQAYQDTKFKSRDNALAITALEEAKGRLLLRREERFARGVLNKHEV